MTTPTTKRVVKTPGQIDYELWWTAIGNTGSVEDGWSVMSSSLRDGWEKHAASLPTPIQPLTEDVPEPKTDGELLVQATDNCSGHVFLTSEADDIAAEFLRLRAERDGDAAEERCDMYKQLYRHALDCVDRVFQECLEIPNPILPNFAKLGEDKFRAVVRLAEEYKRLRERDGDVAKSEPPANMNDAPVFMHANGFSTERNAVVAVMRSAGLDDTDFRLRDKLIFAASPWIQAERESAKKLDVTRETIADWYMEWRADQDTPRQSEWFAFLAAKINHYRGVRPVQVPQVTAEMMDESDTKWRESKGSRHERYSAAADYLNAKLAKQAGKVGETCQ